MKKIVSFVLTLTMLLSLCVTSAFAAGESFKLSPDKESYKAGDEAVLSLTYGAGEYSGFSASIAADTGLTVKEVNISKTGDGYPDLNESKDYYSWFSKGASKNIKVEANDAIVTITVMIGENVKDGNYKVTLNNIVLGTSGYVDIKGDKVTATITVGSGTEPQPGEVEVEVETPEKAVADPELKEGATDKEKKLAEDVTKSVQNQTEPVVSEASAKEAAETVAKTVTDEQVAAAVSKIADAEGKDVSVVVKPYMDIKVTDVKSNDDGKVESYAVDVTPKYKVLATTGEAKDADEKNEDTEVVTEGKLTIAKCDLTLPLPAGFAKAGDELYVKHNGKAYKGIVSADALTLVIKDYDGGFSPFEIFAPGVVVVSDPSFNATVNKVEGTTRNTYTVTVEDATSETYLTTSIKYYDADAKAFVVSTSGESFSGTTKELNVTKDAQIVFYLTKGAPDWDSVAAGAGTKVQTYDDLTIGLE